MPQNSQNALLKLLNNKSLTNCYQHNVQGESKLLARNNIAIVIVSFVLSSRVLYLKRRIPGRRKSRHERAWLAGEWWWYA